MENKVYDAAIIGMGPSGIAAAIYLKRSGISPLCFEKNEVGGKLNTISEIENYPSFMGSGKDLALLMQKQVEHFDLNIIHQFVTSINQNDDGTFLIRTLGDTYNVKGVIVASGIQEKPLNIPNSETYFNNGISRCAECDGPFHKNKPVAVYSSSASGLKEASYLATICSKVYVINPEESYQASHEVIDKFLALGNTEIISNVKIEKTSGTRHIEQIVLSNQEALDIDGLFIFIGASPISEFLGYMDVADRSGFIKVDEHMATKVSGLYAVGDTRVTSLRQVITAVSDGGIAAVSLRNYLREKK